MFQDARIVVVVGSKIPVTRAVHREWSAISDFNALTLSVRGREVSKIEIEGLKSNGTAREIQAECESE